MRFSRIAQLAAVLATSILAACGGSDGPEPSVPTPVATVAVSGSAASVVVGGTIQFSATTRDASGNSLAGRSVSWSASPTNVGTISSAGAFTAVQAGTVTVTATSEGKTGQATATVTAVPIASITISGPVSALAGATAQLTASAKDAQGAVLNGRTITWTVSPLTAATVSAAGLVTAIQPGNATITATAEGVSGTASLLIADPRNIPFFDKPFAGEFPIANPLDHDIPKEFVDNNGRFTTFWGEVHTVLNNLVDGHSGYDFSMPTGTPLKSVAIGTVARIETSQTPFFCEPLNRNVGDQQSVWIEHLLPGGVRVQSWYVHMSRIDVTVGQAVTAGQQIGLSGNTGCSTSPHLHFETYRVMPNNTLRTIDPYGWQGTGTDPWEIHADGAASIQLWKAGQAPTLDRELTFDINSITPFAPVILTKIVFEGINDAVNLNNEYVELTLDQRFVASQLLNNFGLRPQNNAALDYRFPNGITLNAANPTIRIYTGSGTNTNSRVYLGRTTPLWNNNRLANCARVLFPTNVSGLYFICPP